MKDFNLERALAGDPVVSAEKGLSITELTLFSGLNDGKKLVGICEGELRSFYLDGTNLSWKITLKMAPKIKTYWFNVYKNNLSKDDVYVHCAYQTEEEAIRGRLENHDFLKLVSFELEV